MKNQTLLNQETPPIANVLLGEGWIDANVNLPDELETVFVSNGNGWLSIGCRVYMRDCGWHWAESNGVIYEEKGQIVAECESDDLDVKYWHKLPKPPFNEDNLILPPKKDYDLRKKMFNDFFEWHKKQNYVSIKRDDFDEFLDSY